MDRYEVELKPQAQKDMRRLSKRDNSRVFDALEKIRENLAGDVKRLTNFTPEYRLRVGNYRVLFEIEDGNRVVIYRVRHRRDAYRD
ncbi:MAG: type II toxin-antitoxin system RelE/ParE family toxin [Caldilineaceae bacterium]|nr:type II toxin-antitoxin system RelE/ParE family toxin [Caldilineaceae bacterium]MBP8109695.1 type II toxin-antitoxin system RelE/ParE family toxin [Caldilineaceae bacterium]MBP8124475.1 type II toxin-antitoxin system RelE/ParE family toxin [Caldilineaceae bacterium]